MTTVLIVDDDEPIRESIDMVLQDVGFTCLHAAHGEDALHQLRASVERLVVILDLMMPHLSGRDVLEAVEADRRGLGQHAFILLTAAGKTLPLALVQLLDRLNVPVVGKPFDVDRLVDVVTQAAQRLLDSDRSRGRAR